jgi:hypothetical protein
MAYSEREAEATAQIAEAQNAYIEHRRATEAVRATEFDFLWKKDADGEHLHKISSDGVLVRDLGTRNAKLESIANGYGERKAAALAAHDHWSRERQRMEKLNVGHQVGRLLVTPVKVLNVLWERRLMGYYTVIGTYAMYAYEAAAGVVFDEPTMATNDVDLFYTADKQMKFAELATGHQSMVDVLREADPTFGRNEDQKESATNDKGFSIDFLRREEAEKFTDAFSISGAEGDIYPVKARRSNRFLGSPAFEQVVIAVDGSMTLMRTIDPKTFMEFKEWMSGLPDREALKRNRDKLQALAVKQRLADGRLTSKL